MTAPRATSPLLKNARHHLALLLAPWLAENAADRDRADRRAADPGVTTNSEGEDGTW